MEEENAINDLEWEPRKNLKKTKKPPETGESGACAPAMGAVGVLLITNPG